MTSDFGLDFECGSINFVWDTSSHYALTFYEVSLDFASVIYKLLLFHDLRHTLTSDTTVALTLGIIFLCSLIRFASVCNRQTEEGWTLQF